MPQRASGVSADQLPNGVRWPARSPFTSTMGAAPETYYRYDDRRTTGGVYVSCSTYPVLRRTPKGVWLDLGFGLTRFVRDDARRQFACPTEPQALESFRARKRRQIKILEAQLQQARVALETQPAAHSYSSFFSDDFL